MIQYDIFENHDKYILDKTNNKKFHYDNPKEMQLLTDYINKLVNENYKLNDDYESLKITKNIIREKLLDYQRIATRFKLISSTELEWLLYRIFQEKPELKDEIGIKHMKEYCRSIYD